MSRSPALAVHEQTELERIEAKLAKILSRREARELAMRIYDAVLDVDQEIDRILQYPLVEKLYEYDGRFFTPRGITEFHTAFDGLHILRSVGNWIDTFFKGRSKESAIRWILGEIQTHYWVAKRRRMNWEEFGTLGLIPEQTIKEIIDDQHLRVEADPPPLSPEEVAFFKFFEEQLEAADL